MISPDDESLPGLPKPLPGTVLGESWINFAAVGSASAVEEVPAKNDEAGPAALLKVGHTYTMSGHGVPYKVKVLNEVNSDGWFRVQAVENPPPTRRVWWVRLSALSSLTEVPAPKSEMKVHKLQHGPLPIVLDAPGPAYRALQAR